MTEKKIFVEEVNIGRNGQKSCALFLDKINEKFWSHVFEELEIPSDYILQASDVAWLNGVTVSESNFFEMQRDFKEEFEKFENIELAISWAKWLKGFYVRKLNEYIKEFFK